VTARARIDSSRAARDIRPGSGDRTGPASLCPARLHRLFTHSLIPSFRALCAVHVLVAFSSASCSVCPFRPASSRQPHALRPAGRFR
jgi:hypothetical protein